MQVQQRSQQFKKQALEYILSIYLKRQNDEDIKFIRQNIKTTEKFANNVSSSIKYGLNQDSIQKNKLMYGRNSKKYIKTINLKEIVLRVIQIHNILITIISLIQIIYGTVLKNKQIYMDAVYVLVIQFCVLLIRIVTIYFNERKKSQQSYQKNKNQKCRVFRDGTFMEIPQTKIVVGDIVQLDYKQNVPASGILISNQQIAMNQQKFGKKVQKKMSIEKSISYINKLSHLQLKIDAEKQALPSPILLRGTYQVYGSTYRMMVLTVLQEDLLDKHKIPQDPTFVSKVIRDWFFRLQKKSSTIMKIISVLIFLSFIFLFGLKQFLERKHLSGQMFFTDLFSVLLMSILGFSVFDTNCLRLFFQTQVISYTQNLNNPKQVDKYLTVEQIYITEDNIVKYDSVNVCQIGIPDKENIIKYEDLNILANNLKNKIQEVLEGVGLKCAQKKDQTGQTNKYFKEKCHSFDPNNRFNQIIHVNTVDQKIFSSLYNKDQQVENNINNNLQTSMIANPFPNQQNASNISLNKVTPCDEDQFINLKMTKKSKLQKKQLTLSKKIQLNSKQLGLAKESVANQDSLKGYLSQFCKFKTQNIVQSIVQLAKQQSKTYYYQKYTLNRLKKIPHVFSNGFELEMNKQKIQKTKRIVRNMRLQQNGLTPFLIGYSDGAYNNNSMNVLVAVIGVKINYQNEIIQRLKQLSKLGINSSILIQKQQQQQTNSNTKQNLLLQTKMTNDLHEQQDYNKIILAQYLNRGWISHEAQQIIDFSTLYQSGGMIRCQNCYLSQCDCNNRGQQISNIQGFMSSCQNTKIIHSIQKQSDLQYLQIGSEQIKNSVIMITKYKSDTIKILQDIKKGYYLSSILQKGLNVWFGFMFVSATCFYPLALVSFGGVFCSGDLSLWTLFIQSLPAIGNLDLSTEQNQKLQNRSRKSKVLYSKKSTLSVFLLCMLSTIFATVFYIKPNMIIQQNYDNIAADIQRHSNINFYRDCTYQFSIFISDQFNKIKCHPPRNSLANVHQSMQVQGSTGNATNTTNQTAQDKNYNMQKIPQFIYSQNVNFIFSYLCLNMFIFLIVNFKSFSKIRFLLLYASFFGIYFFVIYAEPDIIHGRYDGLTGGQLLIVFGMSALTNLLIQGVAYFMNYSCAVCETQQFQNILSFEDDMEQHYSTKLKKYNSFQTDIYTLN